MEHQNRSQPNPGARPPWSPCIPLDSPKEESGRSQETDEERTESDERPTVLRYVVPSRRLGHGVHEAAAAAPGDRETVVALRTAACQDVAATAVAGHAAALRLAYYST